MLVLSREDGHARQGYLKDLFLRILRLPTPDTLFDWYDAQRLSVNQSTAETRRPSHSALVQEEQETRAAQSIISLRHMSDLP